MGKMEAMSVHNLKLSKETISSLCLLSADFFAPEQENAQFSKKKVEKVVTVSPPGHK